MKIDPKVLDVESNLTGEKIKLSIDEDAMTHIMSVLTDLYEDAEKAVIREYATNGRDEHVKAGVSLPVQVTLPSTLSPYLKIRDFGEGLDADDIRDIYSRYGASTKRDTNDLVGSLGLGCKSALTYTDQFTVQGIKNGRCVQIAVSRDEDGAGSMTLVSEYDTDEASGVEITVPVKAYNQFETKARELFQYWPEGSVEINGEAPERFSGIKLTDGIYAVNESYQSQVVMGGVPYPATFDDDSNFSVVAFVDIGDVEFTPSRESLKMTAKTKAVLASIGSQVTNLKEQAVQSLVDEAESKPEALRRALEASAMFGYKGEVYYKGKLIPRNITIKDAGQEKSFLVYRPWKRGYGARMVGDTSHISLNLFPKSLFMVGFDTTTLSQTQKNKIGQYLRDLGIQYGDYDQVILLEKLPFSSYVDKIQIIDWAEVKAIKLEKQENQDGRPKGAYDVILPDNGISSSYHRTTVVEAGDLADHDGPVYWFPYSKSRSYQESTYLEMLRTIDPKSLFVHLKANRIGKFERDFKSAERTSHACKRIAQDWFDNLTDDDQTWLAVQKLDRGWAQLDETEIDDPNLQLIILQSKIKNDALRKEAATYQNLYTGDLIKIDTGDYPLLNLSELSYKSDDQREVYRQHIVLYLNAVYAAKEESN
jgi:hypothetical protein